MKPPVQARRITLLSFLFLLAALSIVSAQTPPAAPGVFGRDAATTLFPATVFYRGQVASIQARNSAGFRTADSRLALAAIVDTSGYASSVQQTYQAYLITEVPLKIGDAKLPPGAYGFGFIAGDRMVAMDLGGNQLLAAATTADAHLPRPTPLQILPDPTSPTRFRLYLGRSYVTLEAEKK